jgi:hypothetical protein
MNFTDTLTFMRFWNAMNASLAATGREQMGYGDAKAAYRAFAYTLNIAAIAEKGEVVTCSLLRRQAS